MDNIDEIDIKILETLQRQGRIPVQSLAEHVGLSATPCSRRVKQLEDKGIIEGYVAVLSPQHLGLKLNVFVDVRLKNSSSETIVSFERAIATMPEVVEAYFVTGNHDYLLHVRVEDADGLKEFLRERLLKIPNVGETLSSIVLHQIKHTTALTLPRLAKPVARTKKRRRQGMLK